MAIDINRLGPDARRQIAAKVAVEFMQKNNAGKSKYGNKQTERVLENGSKIKFDSKREAERFDELLALKEAGKIRNLRLQVHYTLVAPCILADGSKVAREDYVADFVYEERVYSDLSPRDRPGHYLWHTVVEDVKGVRTAQYKSKRNRMQILYGIEVRET